MTCAEPSLFNVRVLQHSVSMGHLTDDEWLSENLHMFGPTQRICSPKMWTLLGTAARISTDGFPSTKMHPLHLLEALCAAVTDAPFVRLNKMAVTNARGMLPRYEKVGVINTRDIDAFTRPILDAYDRFDKRPVEPVKVLWALAGHAATRGFFDSASIAQGDIENLITKSEADTKLAYLQPDEVKLCKPTPVLDDYATDLTAQNAVGKLPPTAARRVEIDDLFSWALAKRRDSCITTGAAKVGKTAVVYGLVKRLADDPATRHFRVLDLDAMAYRATSAPSKVLQKRGHDRSMTDERKAIIDEVRENKGSVILFIKEFVCHIESNVGCVYPVIGELMFGGCCIGEMRQAAYTEKVDMLPHHPCFSIGRVADRDDSVAMTRAHRASLEVTYSLRIDDDIIVAAVALADRYLKTETLPSSAVRLLNKLCNNVQSTLGKKTMSHTSVEYEIDRKRAELKLIEQDRAIKGDTVILERTAPIRAQIAALEAELKTHNAEYSQCQTRVSNIQWFHKRAREAKTEEERKKWMTSAHQIERTMLDARMSLSTLREAVSEIAKVPVQDAGMCEMDKLSTLAERLSKRVLNQDVAIRAVVNAIISNRVGFKKKKGPIGVFAFAGPTGVGKTELAKAIAAELFMTERALIRFDMGMFSEKHTVSTLFGSPIGYHGYSEGGQLTNAVLDRPYSVLLLDEAEKSHVKVWPTFLRIIDEGSMEDNKGRFVDFSNTIIIFTTNLGASELYPKLEEQHKRRMAAARAAIPESVAIAYVSPPAAAAAAAADTPTVDAAVVGGKRKSDDDDVKSQTAKKRVTLRVYNNKQLSASALYDFQTMCSILKALRDYFRPEFVGRLTVVCFEGLDVNVCARLVDKMISEFKVALLNGPSNATMTIAPEVARWITEKEFDPRTGARNYEKAISGAWGGVLSTAFVKGDMPVKSNVNVWVDYEENDIKFGIDPPVDTPPASPPAAAPVVVVDVSPPASDSRML